MANGARPAGLSAPAEIGRPLSIYRVASAAYLLFDGSGAARFGARWTSPGRAAIYAAGTYAGALLEILAHARRQDLKAKYRCLVIHISGSLAIQAVIGAEVPGWDAFDYTASRKVGDCWLDRAETAVLRVPALTGQPHEHNYVINPRHADTHSVKLDEAHAVVWDERLTRR